MATIILFNKPFRVLPQFTDKEGRATLAEFISHKGMYAAGRLDYDSEGLLLLTDNGRVQQRIADPAFKLEKTYWVQVEGEISDEALQTLRQGVTLKDGLTRPAKAKRIETPSLWDRNPPVRHRKAQPTSWVELAIKEGRNRQVRRMTAAVGFPTLRLVRVAIGDWRLEGLQPGKYRLETIALPVEAQSKPSARAGRSSASTSPRATRPHNKKGQRGNTGPKVRRRQAAD